jgi:hypothetical protein
LQGGERVLGGGLVLRDGEREITLGLAIVVRQAVQPRHVSGAEHRLSRREAVVGGGLQEPRPLSRVLRQAAEAVETDDRQRQLRLRVALVGGQREIADGPLLVFGDALDAVAIDGAEAVFSRRDAAVGGERHQPHRLAEVLGDAAALKIGDGEIDRRDAIAAVGGGAIGLRRLVVALLGLTHAAELEVEPRIGRTRGERRFAGGRRGGLVDCLDRDARRDAVGVGWRAGQPIAIGRGLAGARLGHRECARRERTRRKPRNHAFP